MVAVQGDHDGDVWAFKTVKAIAHLAPLTALAGGAPASLRST